METYVCSDIHGEFDAWLWAIAKSGINLGKGDSLVILGDLIDRGEDSLACVLYVFELMKRYPGQVTYLIGNHERMFLDFVNCEDSLLSIFLGSIWCDNGGLATIHSFLGNVPGKFGESKKQLKERYSEIIKKMSGLPYYKVDEQLNCVYVHAGFESNVPLDKQSKDQMVWIREDFLNGFQPVEGDVLDGKLIVHGHTPVQVMGRYTDCEYNGKGFYKGKYHLNVDGGSARGEKILIVKMNDLSYVEQGIVKKGDKGQ